MSDALQVSEVYGLDEELLAMIPKPVYAMILLFPDSFKDESRDAGSKSFVSLSKDLFFLTQVSALGDACGAIALLHALGNAPETCVENESLIQRIKASAVGKSPEERGKELAENIEFHTFHHKFAEQGATEIKDVGETCGHYICFVHSRGKIVELDGTISGPIVHTECSPETFLETCVGVIKTKFLSRNPEDIRFSMMAICSTE